MPFSQTSTEVVISIVFGVIMFLLAMLTLWQSHKHQCQSGAGTSAIDVSCTELGEIGRLRGGHTLGSRFSKHPRIVSDARKPDS